MTAAQLWLLVILSSSVMASPRSDEAEERFVELVEERGPLYDIGDENYANKITKARLWREIEAELNLTGKLSTVIVLLCYYCATVLQTLAF